MGWLERIRSFFLSLWSSDRSTDKPEESEDSPMKHEQEELDAAHVQLLDRVLDDLAEGRASLSACLRRALLVASAVQDENLVSFIKKELNGYDGTKGDELPSYRITTARSRGHFMGPTGHQLRGVHIPESAIREAIRDFADTLHVPDGVPSLELAYSQGNDGDLGLPWPADLLSGIDEVVVGMQCVHAWKTLPKSFIAHVLEGTTTELLTRLHHLSASVVPSPSAASPSDEATSEQERRAAAGEPQASVLSEKPAPLTTPAHSVLSWLHLSDFHFSGAWEHDVVMTAMIRDLPNLLQEVQCVPSLLFVTGDIAKKGDAGEYTLAESFFESLLKVTGIHKSRVFIAPGNHDVDRSAIRSLVLGHQRYLLKVDQADWRREVGKVFDEQDLTTAYCARHKEFYAFRERLLGTKQDGALCHTELLEEDGWKVWVVCLCSSWCCGPDEDRPGRIVLGERQLRLGLHDAPEDAVRIVLLHHPVEWLSNNEQGTIRGLLGSDVHVVLHGHLHEADALATVRPGGKCVGVLGAGAAYAGANYKHGFQAASIDPVSQSLRVHFFTYSERNGGYWHVDLGASKGMSDGVASIPFAIASVASTAVDEASKPSAAPQTVAGSTPENMREARELLQTLKVHNYYVQNPACTSVLLHGPEWMASLHGDLQEALGRNVLQAADGGALEARRLLDGIAKDGISWPVRFVAGIFMECFVNESGFVRYSKSQGVQYAIPCLRAVSDHERRELTQSLESALKTARWQSVGTNQSGREDLTDKLANIGSEHRDLTREVEAISAAVNQRNDREPA